MKRILALVATIVVVISKKDKYIYIRQGKNFAQADAYCRKEFGTRLATLRNKKDGDALRKIVGGASVYIGLRQKANTGRGKNAAAFAYIDGSGSNYKPFNAGEPNDVGGEDCVEFYGGSGRLNDLKCSTGRYFACNAPQNRRGKNYYIVAKSYNFADANNYCKNAFGTTLATFRNGLDFYNFKNLAGGSSRWIGLKQKPGTGAGKSPNDFAYVDGTNGNYKPEFNNGEPNNAGGNENCIEYWGGGKKLNDLNCAAGRGISCNAVRKKGRKYYDIVKSLSFDKANQYCKRVYGTTLATFKNGADYNNFMNQIKGASAWIGMRQKPGTGAGKSPNDYAYIGKINSKIKPFNKGEPNNAGGKEDCVEYVGGAKALNDLPCNVARRVVCNAATYAKPKKYVKVQKGYNFKKANEYCKRVYNTELATFRNGADYYSFEQIARPHSLWVGLKQNKPGPGKNPRDFAYIDGSRSVYRPFGPGEPNNAGGEDCVEYVGGNRLLNDLRCTNGRYFGCNLPNKKGRKYILVKQSKKFIDAQSFCKTNYGTQLATLTNGKDLFNLNNLVKGHSVWIGMKQKPGTGAGKSPNDYKYIDGHKTKYKPFGFGEPNNAGNSEDCVEFRGGAGNLNDLNCNTGRYFACNKDNTKPKPPPPQPNKLEYVAKARSFEGQMDYCEDTFGVGLVTINSKSDQKKAFNACKAPKCYIGLTDNPEYTDDKDDFWFVDGSESEYNGFAKGQPNTKNGRNCVILDKTRGGKWYTEKCNRPLPAVCNEGDATNGEGGAAAQSIYNPGQDEHGLIDIYLNGWESVVQLKWVIIGIVMFVVTCATLFGVLIYKLFKKNKDYKPIIYTSDSSDDEN